MSSFDQPSLIAGGTIGRFKIITISTAAESAALACNTTLIPIGVTTGGSREAPQDSANTNAAITGDSFEWRSPGSVALVQNSSAAAIVVGSPIMSNATGFALTATANNYVIGIALQNMANAAVGEMLVVSPYWFEA